MEPGSKGRDHFTRPTYPDFKKFCHEFKCLISYVMVWEWCFSNLNNLSQYQTQSSILSSSKSTVGTNQQQIWAQSCQKRGRSWMLTLIWPECFLTGTDLFVIYLPVLDPKILPQKTSSELLLLMVQDCRMYKIFSLFDIFNRWGGCGMQSLGGVLS